MQSQLSADGGLYTPPVDWELGFVGAAVGMHRRLDCSVGEGLVKVRVAQAMPHMVARLVVRNSRREEGARTRCQEGSNKAPRDTWK